MSFSKITLAFRKSISLTHFVTHRVLPLQSLKLMLRNSRSDLLQTSFSRYTKTSYSTKVNEEINKEIIEKKANLEKNGNIKGKEEMIIEETGNKIKKTPPSSRTFPVNSPSFLTKFARDTTESLPNKCNERLLNETIEKGTRPEISEDNLVFRLVIVEHLKRILQPSKNQSFYHVVSGEHGTGKTTLTQIASREVGQVKDKNNKVIQNGGMGVIYVDVPATFDKFAEEFAKAINFKFEEHISYSAQLTRKILGDTIYKFNYPGWLRAMDAFKRGAEVYRKKHGKPPVIIYDNISRLIHKNPEILDILQDDAKDNADKQKYIAVFISSEGSVLRRMESRSAWSRAYKPVMEISDLSEKESKDYLIKSCIIEKLEGDKVTKECKIKDEQVNELYEIVGGRIVDLKAAVDKLLAGQSFESIKQQVLGTAYDNLEAAGMNPGQPNHEIAKIIIKALLNSKNTLHISMLRKITKVDPSKLLEGNVFTYHPKNKNITFQSPSIEFYIKKNVDFINELDV